MSVIRLYREHPGTCKKEILGTLSESQLDFLMENVEEEFDEDEEYLLMQDTINFMKEQGADGDLLAMLEKALAGTEDGVEILYLIE